MLKLIRGILDFRLNVLPHRRDTFAKLAQGQSPDVLFITCSDSRVAPNWFASTDPGDLFVVRNVGNLVPPCDGNASTDHSVAAAIEFAVQSLGVTDIVVCGHSGCGAMHAVNQGLEKVGPPHLKNWLQFAGVSSSLKPDPQLSKENQLSQANVLKQLEHLSTYPEVRNALRDKKLRLQGWWFNIAEAGVYAFTGVDFKLIDAQLLKTHQSQG